VGEAWLGCTSDIPPSTPRPLVGVSEERST
jgi:hypothetical protein